MSAPPAAAQSAGQAPAQQPAAGDNFLRLVHSASIFQLRAAELAASRDTRPEARAFARAMVEFRRELIEKLLAVSRQHMLAVPPVSDFEHRVILENLQPLDFLALSRRYAEVQVQALEQELRLYAGAESSAEEWVRTLARDTRPQLERLLKEARDVRVALGP